MKLPAFIHRRLYHFGHAVINSRPPDEVLQNSGLPYLRRWYVIPHNRLFNIYLHEFLRSDDDRALHDHPWANMSILLQGNYFEHLPGYQFRVRREGFFYLRRPSAAHRIELFSKERFGGVIPVLTIFVTGPHVREWGFLCPQGWRHWRLFTKQIAEGRTAGCGEYGDYFNARLFCSMLRSPTRQWFKF